MIKLANGLGICEQQLCDKGLYRGGQLFQMFCWREATILLEYVGESYLTYASIFVLNMF